ncbi:MAG TPA: hypothetical protein VF736_17820 [Pyrinomonadaceae bacterium]
MAAANSEELDEAEFGRLTLETGVFKNLAARNEPRALQAAGAIKERSARIAALAAIYRRKVTALVKGGAHAPAS